MPSTRLLNQINRIHKTDIANWPQLNRKAVVIKCVGCPALSHCVRNLVEL